MYNIGTVTTTANSPKIIGTGTRWKDNTTLVSVGQVVLIENGSNLLINSIYSIENNTALTLAFPVSAKLTNAKYIILTTMIDSISDGVNKATAQVIASEVYTEILNQWMTAQGTIDVELPTGQKIKLRTVAEIDKQLDGKVDKKGGALTGSILLPSVTLSRNSGDQLNLYAPQSDDSLAFFQYNTIGGSWHGRVEIPKASAGSTAKLMLVGDYGLGVLNSVSDLNVKFNGFFNSAQFSSVTPTDAYFGFCTYNTSKTHGLLFGARKKEIIAKTVENNVVSEYPLYHTGNTTKDSNGNLKSASPIIRVFADHVDPNEEAEGVTLKKLHTGIYQLHGVLGLHSDASWGGINGGITIPCGINQLPLVYALYDVLEKGKQHPFDGRIIEPDEDGDIVLYTTYRKHDLPQNIQYERFKLYPEFLKEVDGEKVELTPGEPCDIPVGHWVDVRVNMPSNSIYNQKQAEAERLAKIEAERLAQEEAKRAAEEVERADQEAAEREQNEVIEN